LKAKGHEISGGRDGSLHVLDPFSYDIQSRTSSKKTRSGAGQ